MWAAEASVADANVVVPVTEKVTRNTDIKIKRHVRNIKRQTQIEKSVDRIPAREGQDENSINKHYRDATVSGDIA